MNLSFKQRVINKVKEIPKGKVLTYKQVAEKAGSPLAFRAVGNILNKNKDPKVPCHRVVRSDGRIGGYRWGVKRKRKILKKEGIIL
jgi:O-6-methylguanine DNA methyltransferase